MNLGIFPAGTVSVKAAWRNYDCYHLDAAFTAPSSPEQQTEFTESIRKALKVECITPCFAQLTEEAWLCTFFHQATRDHRTSTYENGRPGSITYRPREAATFVFDPKHAVFYLSLAGDVSPGPILRTLPGTLLPEKARLPMPFAFNLKKAPFFCDGFSRPAPDRMPWNYFKLKSANCANPGDIFTSQEFRADDLLENPGFFRDHHYQYFRSLTFSVYIPFRKRPHALLIEDGSSRIRANLCADTLPSIATILSFLKSDDPV